MQVHCARRASAAPEINWKPSWEARRSRTGFYRFWTASRKRVRSASPLNDAAQSLNFAHRPSRLSGFFGPARWCSSERCVHVCPSRVTVVTSMTTLLLPRASVCGSISAVTPVSAAAYVQGSRHRPVVHTRAGRHGCRHGKNVDQLHLRQSYQSGGGDNGARDADRSTGVNNPSAGEMIRENGPGGFHLDFETEHETRNLARAPGRVLNIHVTHPPGPVRPFWC